MKHTKNVTFDRAHFSAYKDFSLVYEVVYFVNNNDYDRYMDAQQQINLKLKQEFEHHLIKFAYPTQVNYLQHDLSSENLQKNLEASFHNGRTNS
ncbi:mechanosensitive ion channel family protein [Waterburya agarophytonicola K14]|uniref:Mechanosensitive ion channel family protein n=1 Tax=Waterburya agarophytonicola KI4 TaxID=2874699 RepID=A0A964BU61_9CYAN|nr:mechanosensitive ion channel family protein [Waterburya agarophytonicola KI4]